MTKEGPVLSFIHVSQYLRIGSPMFAIASSRINCHFFLHAAHRLLRSSAQ
jgi:hypothetical protein